MKTFTLLIGLLLTALGATAQNSGTTGPLTWNYDAATKTLSITGTGAMPDYEDPSSRPWNSFKDNIETVTIGSGVTTIGAYAFIECHKLAAITLPSSVTAIGKSAFLRCMALPAFEVDAGSAHFSTADGVLYNKAKTELICYPIGKPGTAFTVPAGVKKIGNAAFGSSQLQSITLPDGLTTIEEYAFHDCVALQRIAIPAGVTRIEREAFSYCTGLTEVIVGWSTPIRIEANIFEDITLANITLRVPAGKVATYQAASVWKDFGTIVAIATALPARPEALGLRIGTAAGKLRFTAERPVEVRVFTPSGSCVAVRLLPAGESALSLPQGIYLVQAGTAIGKYAVVD